MPKRTASRSAKSRTNPSVIAATMLSPAPTVLRTGTSIGANRSCPFFETSSAPCAPNEMTTTSTTRLSMSSRPAATCSDSSAELATDELS